VYQHPGSPNQTYRRYVLADDIYHDLNLMAMTADDMSLTEIIDKISDNDLKVLIRAKHDAQVRVVKDPSRENLDAYDKASRMLAAYLEGEKEPVFENRIEVLKYLNRQGYAIQKSKLYADCKAGLLRLQADKTVLESDIKAYIRKAGLEKPAETIGANQGDQLVTDRREAELERLQQQIIEYKYKNEILEGKYILKTEAEVVFAIKIGVFESSLKQLFSIRGIDYVRGVNGDLQKIKTMTEMFHADLDALLHEMGNIDELSIEIRKN